MIAFIIATTITIITTIDNYCYHNCYCYSYYHYHYRYHHHCYCWGESVVRWWEVIRMNNKIYKMNANDNNDDECWAKPSSIYSWKYGSACRQAMLAVLPTPTSKMLERVV